MIYIDYDLNGRIINIPSSCDFDVTEEDLTNGQFDLDKWVARTGCVGAKIKLLKDNLQEYKYDIEQVDFFGMQRDDYEQKKQMCRDIILQLRELEKSEV